MPRVFGRRWGKDREGGVLGWIWFAELSVLDRFGCETVRGGMVR